MIKNYKLTASLYANDYRPELKISLIFYKQSLYFICSHFYRAPKVVECKIDSAIFNVKYQLSAKMLGLLTKWAQAKESYRRNHVLSTTVFDEFLRKISFRKMHDCYVTFTIFDKKRGISKFESLVDLLQSYALPSVALYYSNCL